MLFRVYTLYPSDCLLAWGYTFVGNDEYLADLAIGNYKNAIHGIHLQYVDRAQVHAARRHVLFRCGYGRRRWG